MRTLLAMTLLVPALGLAQEEPQPAAPPPRPPQPALRAGMPVAGT